MTESALGLQSLAAMAHVLMLQQPLEHVLESAAEHACDALGAATVSISRFESDPDLVRTIINVGDLGPGEERWPADEVYLISDDERLARAMLGLTTTLESVDDPACTPTERALLERLGKGSSLAKAIVVDGRVWGEFYATRYRGAQMFDGDAVAYAEVLVAILASAVSRSLRESALEDLAFRDPLTGLLNRRALDERAAEIFAVPRGDTRAVSIVVIDINGLKVINDTLGHARGDEQIRAVADTLTAAFEPLGTSVIARVGGDEFTVLVAGHDEERVMAAINEGCRRLSRTIPRPAVSAGVASAVIGHDSDIRATDLFAAADRAQYVAKRADATVALRFDDLPT
ncbi:MAG: hypothetical protein JWP31_429 [Aeromicrobium sp.]|nr:hypothetical protein [Aeromicrobium sp.]